MHFSGTQWQINAKRFIRQPGRRRYLLQRIIVGSRHWSGGQYNLPVDDARLSTAMADGERTRIGGRALARALGHRPHYLLVALAPPRNGHCYKTVAAVLPRQ